MSRYPEYKSLNLPQIGKEILDWWEKENIFEKSVSLREGKTPFVFYEGPPSANGMPGIHHVMARTVKDIFCRYQTLKDKQVKRKAGWDTHGLPIEIAVEKSLGITKEDIGKKISVEEYNKACRKEVLQYQDKWEELTRIMGYWVDMEHPYVTYENNYIESVWWLLKELYNKKLLYKGYTIQPYSPAAGTGLSTHELNQPGCYRNVKDTSIVAQFKVREDETFSKAFTRYNFNRENIKVDNFYFLAWTTTPWTLPANCALAVGKDIYYNFIAYINKFSSEVCVGIIAEDLYNSLFTNQFSPSDFKHFDSAERIANKYKNDPIGLLKKFSENEIKDTRQKPWGHFIGRVKGEDLVGIKYEQLLPYVKPNGKAHEVILGDFVTTEDGTGIVHTASVFGADDFRVCKENGIVSILVKDENGNDSPLVDKRGKFVKEMHDEDWGFAREYVREEYLSEEEKNSEFRIQKEKLKKYIPNLKEYLSVDERIALKLKLEGKAFRIEKYEHSYPHCWRTDKPILYYPLDSWFVKVTAMKDRMIELNKTIHWKPEHTGAGRFGEWLNNLQDWNLSRSRFWGIPLPIWTASPNPSEGSEKNSHEQNCIGSVEELRREIDKSVAKGFMKENPLKKKEFDLHKPYADEIILTSSKGNKMFREADLIDVWFDSGAMPYAQWHYPFENREMIDSPPFGGKRGAAFPADFIAEGVDQTRGWFYTLHAISVLCFDSVAYKNVVSNGLVLDKNGNKMSKRLGNAVDPFETINKYGPDATRWYLITNADPWDNLKFNIDGVKEKQTGFFSTLYNTYSFFALYANIDNFIYKEKEIPISQRLEIDRWILSELNSLIKLVDDSYKEYEPTKAGRAIEYFVDEHLSNWYVRLCRRRFWKGDYTHDKISAYQTLYRCMEVVAQLSSPIAPFFCEKLFRDLNDVTKKQNSESVHLSIFPKADATAIDKPLEERMELAQKISSMILSIRKKENIRVRQPLTKIRIPILDDSFGKKLEAVKDLILSEVNVKEIEYVREKDTQIVKNLKLNFKTLGKKCGRNMKAVQAFANENAQEIISSIEKNNRYEIKIKNEIIELLPEDVEIIPVDIPGWKVANSGAMTVALDITITEKLKDEGIAREIVNRIQNLRKEKNFEVTDRIEVRMKDHPKIKSAVLNNLDYIRAEILANTFEIVNEINGNGVEIEVNDEIKTIVDINKN